MSDVLVRAFERMGARVKFSQPRRQFRVWGNQMQSGSAALAVNVLRDKDGEFFDIRRFDDVELQVLDVQPKDRHLLLLSREGKEKHRYLLGHDERHWFVAGVPESSPVSTVNSAKLALKPKDVQQKEFGLKTKHRNKRRNDAWVRQGEWFFVPDPNFEPPNTFERPVLRSEPISRGRSKPHMCEYLYRSGGETVYVARGYPSGLTESQYQALTKEVRESRNWQVMKRNMDVWVKGSVRHPDHATIKLDGWHRVYSNTEHLSQAMRNITFLD